VIEQTVDLTLRLAEKNWNAKRGHPHFQRIPGCNHIMLGHDDGMDIFVSAPSDKTPTGWAAVSAAFESKVGDLPRFPGVWDNCLMVRFHSEHRRRLLPFITDLFSSSPDDVDGYFEEVMYEWRSFFDRWGAPLSPEEQRGLLGELIVLENLLENGTASLAEGWLGPSGSLHDFETDDWHIEVKTSLRANPTASIHPLSQLDPIDIPFHLVIVKIRRGEGVTLPHKIQQLRNHQHIRGSSSASSHFDSMLLEIGYDPSDDHHYTTQYEESAECIRLDVNAAPTILQTNRIDGGVKVDDVRWRLVASHHEFKDCDDDFWKNPR